MESPLFHRCSSILANFTRLIVSHLQGLSCIRCPFQDTHAQIRTPTLAQQGECSDVIKAVDDLAQPVPGLAFTRDGLEPFLQSARVTYLIGNVYQSCKVPVQALNSFKQAAEKSSFGDEAWA